MTQAHLFRMVRLNDRYSSQVFTFLIPASIAQDSTMECHSKDFMYGNQKWSIMLSHNEKHLSAYLTLKNVSEGMKCVIDFGFTMLNQEHFTKNESFLERNVEFTRDRPTNGRRVFVSISDILGRRFENEDNFILLECEIRAIRTHFEQVIQLPREGKETSTYRYPKFETNYFTFGNFEWNLSVYPFGDTPESEGRPLIYLTRQTSFGHSCRLQYRLILGYADRILETGILEQVLDTSGGGNPYDVGQTLYSFAMQRVRLPIHVELLSVAAISEIQLDPCRRGKNKSHLYDRDKQAWMLETEIVHEKLKMKLYYADVHNVPRGFSRLMCWGVTVIPLRGKGQVRRALRSPFVKYYVQDETDDGYEMYTDITNSELVTPGNPYRDLENQKMTIHVEWIESHLLLMGKYHRLDETTARHKMHMAREIQALQSENLALEKQLYSYQQSIAKNNARGLDPGTPLATPMPPVGGEPDRGIPGVPGPGAVLPGVPGPQGHPGVPGVPVPQGQRGPIQGQVYNTNSPAALRRRDHQRSMSTEEAPYMPNDRTVAQFQRSNSNQSLHSDRGYHNGRPPQYMRSASQERRAHLEKDGYPGDRDPYVDTPPTTGHRGRDGYSDRQRGGVTGQLAQPPAVQPLVIKPGTAANQVPQEYHPRDIADRLAQKGNDSSGPMKIEPLGDGHQRIHPKQKPQAKVEEPLQTVSKSFVIPPDDPYLSKAKKMLEKKTKEAAAGYMDPYSQKYDDDLAYPPNGQDPYMRDPYGKESYGKDSYGKDSIKDYYGSRDPYSKERESYSKDQDPYRDARDSPASGRSSHHSGRSKDPYGKERDYMRSSSVGHDGYNDNGYSSRNGYRGHEGHGGKRLTGVDGHSDKDSGYRSSSQRGESYRNTHHKNSQRNAYPTTKQKDHRNSYGERGQPHGKSNRDAPKSGLYDVHYNDAYQEGYDAYEYDQNDVYIDRRHRDY